MSLIRWQPMRELDILRRQMDQLFEGLTEHDFPMALTMPKAEEIQQKVVKVDLTK